MRRMLAIAAVCLLGGLGCKNEVCDCCQDICSGCQYPGCGSRVAPLPAPMPAPASAVRSEPIPAPQKPAQDAPKTTDKPEAGRKIENPSLDD